VLLNSLIFSCKLLLLITKYQINKSWIASLCNEPRGGPKLLTKVVSLSVKAYRIGEDKMDKQVLIAFALHNCNTIRSEESSG
jgi:hypothetical protein